MNYYNDNDPKVAAWLRELIKQNLIPAGDVDERSIEDVTKTDLEGYTQCHFFAGIGGWSEALRLAGWPADRPVWTGSCPCQPFSSAGKRHGEKDKRHLWPEFYRLIRECKPNVIFGEQVEKAVGMGWLDRVFADLENENYTCGAAVLGAHSVGAPHIRQRLFWVANAEGGRYIERIMGNKTSKKRPSFGGGTESDERCWRNDLANGSTTSDNGLADTTGGQRQQREGTQRNLLQRSADNCTNGGVDDTHNNNHRLQKQESTEISMSAEIGDWENVTKPRKPWGTGCYVLCKDGKARRIEPSICPLADGLPGRVAMLRGFGNAIVPQVAAEFIKAYEEAIGCE